MQRRHALLQHLDLLVQRRRGQVAVAAVIVRPGACSGLASARSFPRLPPAAAARRRARARARLGRAPARAGPPFRAFASPPRRTADAPRAPAAGASRARGRVAAAASSARRKARSLSRAPRLSGASPLRSAGRPPLVGRGASLVSLAFATSALACSMPRSMRSYRSMCPPTSFMRSSSQRHCHSTSRRYCFHPGSSPGALALPALSPDFSSTSPASAGPSFLERSPEVPCRGTEGLSPAPRLGSDAPGAPESDLCSAALGALSACSPSSTRRSTASPVSVKLLHPLIPFARTFAQADLSSSFAFSVKGAGSVIARGVLRKPRLRTRVHELRRSRKSRRFAKPRSPRRVRRGRRGARDRSETRRSREALSYRAESRSATSRLSRVRLESGEGLGPRDPISGALYFSGQPTPVRAEAR